MRKGSKHTEESKNKIGEGCKGIWIGRKHSEKSKKKMSKASKGKSKYETFKRKLSETWKRKYGEEGYINNRKGKHLSDEIKNKLSVATKGKKKTEEARKRISEGNKGKCIGRECSEETRKKISKKLKGRKYSEKTLRKMSDAFALRMQGRGSFKRTKPELELKKILEKYSIKYKSQFYLMYKKGFKKIYDFCLPEYNILIEVDGYYWHSKNIRDEDIKNERLKKVRENDKIKDKLALENNYNLIRIWEDELDQFGEYCKIFQPILSTQINLLNN